MKELLERESQAFSGSVLELMQVTHQQMQAIQNHDYSSAQLLQGQMMHLMETLVERVDVLGKTLDEGINNCYQPRARKTHHLN